VLTVVIDIKPGRSQDGVNTASLWTLPVAILTTTTVQGEAIDFVATTADPYAVRFGATGTEAMPVNARLIDVDGNGDLDLHLLFPIPETGLRCGDTAAVLAGMTASGQYFHGADASRRCGMSQGQSGGASLGAALNIGGHGKTRDNISA
jgi:hypothetical protein